MFVDPSGLIWYPLNASENSQNIRIKFHRQIWKWGADNILRPKGYHTSAWLLEYSLQENPYDQWRGNDSRIANLIKEAPAFKEALKEVMHWNDSNSDGTTLFIVADKNIEFNSGDLYYAIHGCSITFVEKKQENNKWIVECKMTDVYDYTEISFSMGNLLGTVANDAAVYSSFVGGINLYKITVEFEVEWNE